MKFTIYRLVSFVVFGFEVFLPCCIALANLVIASSMLDESNYDAYKKATAG